MAQRVIFDAIYCDLDGTLVDAQRWHDEALTIAAHATSAAFFGFHADQWPGRSRDKLRAYVRQYGEADDNLDDLILAARERKWIELEALMRVMRVRELDPASTSRTAWRGLRSLARVGIVTDTPTAIAEKMCALLKIRPVAIITRDDVGGIEKPDPAIYWRAREIIGGDHPIALEDSLRGAHAASAAHIPCFLVHGPEGVLEWIAREGSASTTTADQPTTSSRRRTR